MINRRALLAGPACAAIASLRRTGGGRDAACRQTDTWRLSLPDRRARTDRALRRYLVSPDHRHVYPQRAVRRSRKRAGGRVHAQRPAGNAVHDADLNTGKKVILVDTGTGGQIAPSAGALRDNLAAAGFDPKAVDAIVISHFHPDHINGIKDRDNDMVFPNAEIMVPEAEWKFWMDDANLNSAPADLNSRSAISGGYFPISRRT